MLAVGQGPADASLSLVQPSATTPATFVGRGGYSADGLGQDGVGGTLQAEVPAGSTVVQAYLYGGYFGSQPTQAQRTIDFDGTSHELTQLAAIDIGFSFFLSSARADVTGQVASKVGSGGGITNFAVNTDPSNLDGVALVVIYSNPALPEVTIALLDGAQATAGDSVTFNFAAPLDKTVPGFSAIMSLGIGFGYQNANGHECGNDPGSPQYSLVDVNTTRLTSCAGNYDDGYAANGGLITVGGVGDSTNNPADPLQRAGDGSLPRVEDDELYDLAGLLGQGDTAVTIHTSNPSNNDLVFLSVMAITARATVTTENCTDTIDNDGDQLIDAADPDCQTSTPTGTDRMTGGGNAGGGLTHGFVLHCNLTPGTANNLQVNWGSGRASNRFHLTSLDTTSCTDGGGIDEGTPEAGFDTITGTGTGRYNGVPGATAEWTFTDAGEPGRSDGYSLVIRDAGNNVVHSSSGTLKGGNHQAHPDEA